ncbi:hypothetical protein [Campylobacter sp. JMF_08 NE1]|uniref:hypothetical protein n=1 Tax=Campylobacter sp. JMF_08 NE1 TaxID=2983821 RepID=UPI0022E9C293|nr:hypothetical protein [Campylobacter sp. JMF_08 NE1]MDA3048578.1 hypothetical protein [Campylobacter sp. JMF_08 NE1]
MNSAFYKAINKYQLKRPVSLNQVSTEYLESLEHFVNVFKQTHDTTLTFESFVLQCYTKGYKLANFATTFILWSAKNPKDKSKGETLRERKERFMRDYKSSLINNQNGAIDAKI